MIRITCGTCGTSQGYKTAADGPLALPASEEKRLVRRGVAEYVTRPVIGNDADSPVEGGDAGGAGIDPSDDGTALEGLENGGSEDTADLQEGEVETDDVLDIVDGHFTFESLMKLSRPDMNDLGDKLGVDVRKCKNKSEAATALTAVEVQADESGETPPELGVEAPVV